ncbi:hypothetical protein J8631_27365, partial [Serratia fonticola]|nr:hypothetical protein [Serratia fonticola]
MIYSNVNFYSTKGAVVQVNIATHIVYQVLMTLIQKNQQPVPFGAIATLTNMPIIDANASIVGDNGYIYLSSLP